jgi:hypothetical protein
MVVTGGICSNTVTVNSNSITINVLNTTVTITPSANNICPGTSVTFTAAAANTGGGTITYTFKKNGVSVQSGLSNTYTTNSIANGNNFSVGITVTGSSCGNPSANSNAVVMNVSTAPVPSVAISASPGNSVCTGVTVTYTAVPTNGGTSPAYQWTRNGSNITGANSSTYSVVAGTGIVNGDVIRCVLTSNATCASPTTANSSIITMTVNPIVTPSLVINVPSSTICAGSSATFTASPTNGGTSPTYQWRRNGLNISGATGLTYTTTTLANNDVISCVMTSNAPCQTASTATSNNITITVDCPVIWLGTTSTNWNTGSNWSTGVVPTSSDNILISNLAVNDCVLSGIAAVNNFTLNGSTLFRATSTATLTINGNVNCTNPAVFVFDLSSTLNLLSTVNNQFVPATNYSNLNLGTGTRELSPTGTIGISGTYTPTTGALTTTGSTVSFNGAAQNIPTATFNNLIIAGTGNKTLTGNLTINGDLSVNANTLNLVNFTANRASLGGTLSIANGSALLIGGTNTFPSNYADHLIGCTSTVEYNGANQTVGNLNSSQSYGNLILSGSGIKTLQVGTISICNDFTTSGTCSTTGVVGITIGRNITIGAGTTFIAGAFTHNIGGNFNRNGTFTATGSTIQFNGSSTQQITNATTFENLTLNNVSGLTLNNATTVASVLNLLSGNLTLGTNNLTITNTASGAITGLFSNSNMIIADNTGQLVRATVTGTSYTYPIGDATGSLDYSPVSINFSAKSAASNIGFRVVDAVHPSINAVSVQVDYISRYWISSNSSSPTYTYTATFDYVSSDINGSAANISINKWDGSIWTQAILSQSVANQLSLVTSETHTRMSFSSTAEFTGRVKPGEIYTWNQTGTADYTEPTNWTPTRTTPLNNDVLQFNNGATTTATNVPTEAIAQLLITNNTNVSLTSAIASTISITNGNGADLQVSTGSSINIASSNGLTIQFTNTCIVDLSGTLSITGSNSNTFNTANSITTVTGTINNSGVVIGSTASLLFNASSTYNHNYTIAAGAIPLATWNAASNTNITSYTTGGGVNFSPSNLNQLFGNFSWNCPLQSNDAQLNGALTSIAGNLNIVNTNTSILKLSNNATVSINVGGNFSNSGNANLSSGSGANVAMNIGGNFTQTAGTLCLAQTGSTTRGTLNVLGDFNFSAGTISQTASPTNGSIALIEFNGIVAQNVISSGTYTGSINYRLNNAAGASVSGTILVNQNATFYLKKGTLSGTGVCSYNATSSNLMYEGTTALTTSDVEWPSNNTPINVIINNSSTVSLNSNKQIGSTAILTETTGLLKLGDYDLTIANTSTNAIVNASPSASNMIVTDGAGKLKRGIAAGANSYLYPLGDDVGTLQYSPISLNFSSNSTSRIVGFSVKDVASANINVPNAPLDYLSRTWYSSENGAGGIYSYTPTLTYATSGDINGNVSNSIFASWDGAGWVVFPTTVSAPNISPTSDLSEAAGSGPLTNAELTSRSPIIYWIGGTSTDWNTASNWSSLSVPTSTDNIVISNLAVNDCELSGTGAVNHFTLNGTRSFHATSTATLSIFGNLNYSNPAGILFDCSSTLNLLSTIYDQFVPAANYGNLNLGTGTRTLDATGVINICNNFTNTTGTLNVLNSTINFNGTTAQTSTGGGSFFNLQVNNLAGVTTTGSINVAAALDLTNGKITIGNHDLNIAAGGLVVNGNSDSYVKTNGTGRFKQHVSNVSTIFHVGNSSYNPITLTNNGTTDVYGVKLVDGSVGTENDNTKIVNRHWDVTEAVAGGSNLDIIGQWNAPVAQAGEEASNFVRADVYKYIGLYNGLTWETKNATLSGSNPYTYSGTGFTSVGKFELGSSDAFRTFFFTAANGNWNVGSTWVGGVAPTLDAELVTINHNVTVTNTPPAINELVIGTGSIAINSGKSLKINAGGTLTNSNSSAVNVTGPGSLQALGTLSISAGSNPFNVGTLKLSGATSILGNLFVIDTLYMNPTASILSGSPIYSNTSNLYYDLSAVTFARGNEWNYNGIGTIGVTAGYPNNVVFDNITGGVSNSIFNPGANAGTGLTLACEGNLTLLANTYFNMNLIGFQMTAPLKVKGNINIGLGGTPAILTASSVLGSEIYCGGNFYCGFAGAQVSFINNNRVLFMNGIGNQNFTDNSGNNDIPYLMIDKPSGSLTLLTDIKITGGIGNALQLVNAGGIDLNGKRLILNNSGSNILVSGGVRNIFNSSVALSTVEFNSSQSINSTSIGTLVFGGNIQVDLMNGVDFGASVSTITGSLRMLNGGSVISNPPIYSSGSKLEYISGTSFNRGLEWNSTSGPGYPYHVSVTQNIAPTTLNMATGNASPTLAGNLTISNNATLNMQTLDSPLTVNGNTLIGGGISGSLILSSVPDGDLICGGNLTANTGSTITHNGREVSMNGTSGIQEIFGVSSFDFLKVNNTGTNVRLHAPATINNRLWLNQGTLELNGFNVSLAANSLIRRSSGTANLSAAPTPMSTYNLQYDASMNTSNEFVTSTTAIRNLEITAGTLSLSGNRTINNNLVLSGGNLNLGNNTFTTFGNATAPLFAGNISFSGGGSRLISGTGNFNITGIGANNPTNQTKQFTNTGGTTLTFASGVTVNIGDGQVDFGLGNPVTINGTLKVLSAGSVGSSLNACNYGVGSTLLFDNGADYTITALDKTWSLGSSGAGVPYNVTINGLSTDVYLNDDRTIRNNLTIVDAKLHTATMTNGISVKGNWTRTGASSLFDNAANVKVTFNGTSSQTINVGVGITNETFYDLALNNAAGVALGSNTNINVTNQLIFVSGKLDIGTSTNNITIDGTITGGNSLSYINTNYAGSGSVRKSATTNTSYTFPVGDETNYTPISITLYSGAQLGTYLNAKVIAALHPQLGSGQTGYLNRYWSIEQSGLAPGFAYGADFSYAQSDVVGSEATIFPYKWTPGTGVGTGWIGAGGSTAEFQMGSGSVDMVLNTMHWEGIYSFSDITGSGGGTPLPITLVNFDAVKENKKVKLSWTTYSEINNDFFTVEKTTDGINFKAIETLDGAGNHNGILNYSTEDNNPEIGKNYYRLKQTDFNGKYEYSKLVMVEFMQDFTKSISLHPNPSNGQDVKLIINGITSENLIQLKLFSSNGSQVFSENSRANNGSNPILIPTKNLSNGIYYLQINIDGSISTIKLVVVNN